MIYEPYIVWNWWAPPVWQPLPEAACGTWVDVKPIVVEPEQYDLQLLAVRMVDPGHPEEKLGPRYRVWFRNNSNKPITQPFSVMLFAGNDKRFGQDLPRGGVRVTSIEAGDTQSVDIRLPIEVYTMNRDAAGQPAPFEFLHFFVDANREINDVSLANNGAVVPREEMLPVDPAAFEIDPAQSQRRRRTDRRRRRFWTAAGPSAAACRQPGIAGRNRRLVRFGRQNRRCRSWKSPRRPKPK